ATKATERKCAENSAVDRAHPGEGRERERFWRDYRYLQALAEWACALGRAFGRYHQADCGRRQCAVGRTCADETGSGRKAKYSGAEANHYDSGTQACNNCSRDSETTGYAAAKIIRRHLSNQKSSFRPRLYAAFFFVVFRAPNRAKAVSLEITNQLEGANVCRFAAGFRFDQPLSSRLDDSDFFFCAGATGCRAAHGSTSLYGRLAVAAPDATGGDWTTTIARTCAQD